MTAPAALLARLEAIRGVRVAVAGDVMLDRFVHGAVERISPEAPIPVLRIERQSTMLGGCGNVVRNLAALGAEGALIAAVGDDEAGRAVKGLTAELKGIAAHLAVEPGRRTGIKTRYLAGQQQLMRADDETVGPIGEATRATLLAALAAEAARAAAVVLSDYGKGVLGPDFTRDAIAAARRAGKPVVVDPKGADYAKYRGASVLTPNRKELAEATRLPTDDDAAVVAAARRLLDEVGAEAVLATRGRDGMTLVAAKGEPAHFKAEAREVYDVSGAGDTVAATLAAALAAGASLAEAAELANLAGGIVVGKVGTAAVYAEDLAAALHHRDLAEAEQKVLALPRALDRIAVWRRAGMRVGFTNGCFDLLHPGHVALLQKARAACDRLVVGLNSDASVKRLKSPERPLQSETARSTVLASLAGVDLVVVFGEDTPMRLIEAIRPDLLVKGADYALDQVVGGAFVQGYGGRVLLVPLEAGHSTTATIARMAR